MKLIYTAIHFFSTSEVLLSFSPSRLNLRSEILSSMVSAVGLSFVSMSRRHNTVARTQQVPIKINGAAGLKYLSSVTMKGEQAAPIRLLTRTSPNAWVLK